MKKPIKKPGVSHSKLLEAQAGPTGIKKPKNRLGNALSKAKEAAEDFAPPPASKDQMKKIQEAISLAATKMAEVESLSAYLSGVNKEILELREKTIPEAMAAANCESFGLDDGTKVKIKDYISGSLPKDEEPRATALEWLTANGGEDIIKAQIEATFPRGDKKAADKARIALRKLRIDFKDTESVHAQTLWAFAREKLKGGENIPLETLGLYTGRAAMITLPKRKED